MAKAKTFDLPPGGGLYRRNEDGTLTQMEPPTKDANPPRLDKDGNPEKTTAAADKPPAE